MKVYYNEINDYCCMWLENMMKVGKIPKGDIDNRSIEDVKPSEIQDYDQCHFFAGIGVFAKALIDQEYEIEGKTWTGSCPCQPFSTAGKRNGFNDERHLWPHWHHLISQCKPRTIFGEQVARGGKDWINLVSSDLEGIGYIFAAVTLPACGFGAPHIRARNFFVAENSTYAKRNKQPRQEPCCGPVGRVGWLKQSFPWDISSESALRRFRVMDDGSYGVAATDAVRNSIVLPVAKEFIRSYIFSREDLDETE